MALETQKLKEDTFREMKEGLISRFQTAKSMNKVNFKSANIRASFQGPPRELAWNGSLNSILSADNITDELLKESVQELQKALQESQTLLQQRDAQIGSLREKLDCSKKTEQLQSGSGQEDLLKELELSQRKIMELEADIASLKQEKQVLDQDSCPQLPPRLFQSEEGGQPDETVASKYSTCTCYCGSMCRALKEASEAKHKLENMERKYTNLKQRIRERRRAAESMSRGPIRVTVTEKSPGCTLQ